MISIDNHHNSHPKALDHVANIARDALPLDASDKEKDSAEIEGHACDLTSPHQVRNVFEKYGKGGIWGVIHIAVRTSFPFLSFYTLAFRCPNEETAKLMSIYFFG